MVDNIKNIKYTVNQANIIAPTQNFPTNYNSPVLNKYNTNNSSHITHHHNTISYRNTSIKVNISLNKNTTITKDNHNIKSPTLSHNIFTVNNIESCAINSITVINQQ